MSRSRLAPQDRQRRLLAAGRLCLARHGLDGFTLEKVSQIEGTSKSLINRYFGSRDGLLAAVFMSILPPTAPVDTIPAISEAQAVSRLVEYIDANFDERYFAPENFMVWMAIWRELKTNEALYARYAQMEMQFTNELSSLIENVARFRGLDPDCIALARTVLALMDGLWLKCTMGLEIEMADSRALTYHCLAKFLGPIGPISPA